MTVEENGQYSLLRKMATARAIEHRVDHSQPTTVAACLCFALNATESSFSSLGIKEYCNAFCHKRRLLIGCLLTNNSTKQSL